MHYILKDFLECNQGQLAWNGAQITSKYPTNRYWSDGSCFFLRSVVVACLIYENSVDVVQCFKHDWTRNGVSFKIDLKWAFVWGQAHSENNKYYSPWRNNDNFSMTIWLYDDNDCSCSDDDDDDWKNLQFALKYVQCFIQCIDSSSRRRSSVVFVGLVVVVTFRFY